MDWVQAKIISAGMRKGILRKGVTSLHSVKTVRAFSNRSKILLTDCLSARNINGTRRKKSLPDH